MGRINSVIIIMKRGRLLSCAVVFLRHWLGGGGIYSGSNGVQRSMLPLDRSHIT